MPFDVAFNRMKHYEILGIVIEKFIPEADIDTDAYERLKQIKKESKERWIAILKRKNILQTQLKNDTNSLNTEITDTRNKWSL